MNAHIRGRIAASALTLSLGAGLLLAGPSGAEPPREPAVAPHNTLVDQLAEQTSGDQLAQPGIAALRTYLRTGASAGTPIGTPFAPFSYAAPTVGCGSNGLITTVLAAATANGPSTTIGANSQPGTLKFHATPGHTGVPQRSGLMVAWINSTTGASGIHRLDEMTDFGTPALARTVASGPGTVLAALWGTVDYPGARCVMLPTVGTFTVPTHAAN